ncbi:uncharacterized protein LOC62_02G002663 [Vanrija pseudolonga]|uniref:Extracellular membrane protein CFEM domain-containing protein n=1 Tax=Vanrija pseudolonga TaxID=143232 RepID=A0AAF1BIU2_9TREE|nr:hypothetical protein LOC62_02G002663 [Vanrija pseudolonga]
MVALRLFLLTALASTALAQNGTCQAECGNLNEFTANPCADASKTAIQKCADCAATTHLQSLQNATLQLQNLCNPTYMSSVSASRVAASASASSAAAAAAASNASHSAANATGAPSASATHKPSSAAGLGVAGSRRSGIRNYQLAISSNIFLGTRRKYISTHACNVFMADHTCCTTAPATMLVKSLLLTAAIAGANAHVRRQDSSACLSQCQEVAGSFTPNAAWCAADKQAQVKACYTCIAQNNPDQADVANQTIDALNKICANGGDPSVVTGGDSSGGSSNSGGDSSSGGASGSSSGPDPAADPSAPSASAGGSGGAAGGAADPAADPGAASASPSATGAGSGAGNAAAAAATPSASAPSAGAAGYAPSASASASQGAAGYSSGNVTSSASHSATSSAAAASSSKPSSARALTAGVGAVVAAAVAAAAFAF